MKKKYERDNDARSCESIFLLLEQPELTLYAKNYLNSTLVENLKSRRDAKGKSCMYKEYI
jgi:hypothetical protein